VTAGPRCLTNGLLRAVGAPAGFLRSLMGVIQRDAPKGYPPAVTNVEQGYEWLSERAANAFERLDAIQVVEGSPLLADDQFFHPIHRTLSQDVTQCLLSALDHLRFLVWSLKARDKPYPLAQATLIRTATTGAATALWIVSGRTPLDRRCRALEFMFNDLRSQLTWMNSTLDEPRHRQEKSPEEISDFGAKKSEVERRLDWIVLQANTLLAPTKPFTRGSYKGNTTSDTDMVKAAGAITSALGTDGWNPELVLLNTWQLLSGYAHARPWAYSLGTRMTVSDPEPDPVTGTIRMTAEGDPDRLLDFAFRAIIVVENGIGSLETISRKVP
jgi:hypothetical protein